MTTHDEESVRPPRRGRGYPASCIRTERSGRPELPGESRSEHTGDEEIKRSEAANTGLQ